MYPPTCDPAGMCMRNATPPVDAHSFASCALNDVDWTP